MKTPTFPHRIKRGSASVTIYKTLSHGYESFILYYTSAGKTHRQTFPDFAQAKEEAWTKCGQLDCGEGAGMSMSSEDRAAFLRAKQLLPGVPLEVAAAEYAQSKKILGALMSLPEAAELAVKIHGVKKPNITVGEVAGELLKDRASSVCPEHLRVLRLMLHRVSGAFNGVRMGSIDGPIFKAFLDGMEASPRTRNNYRQVFGQLVNFAKFQGYVSRDFEVIERIQEYKETPGAIEIYAPSQIAMLLNKSPDSLLPFLAIGAFAGLRHAEIARLDWGDVSLVTGYVTVQAAKAKTGSRRIVPITPNLARWLAPYAKSSGPVCSCADMTKFLLKLAKDTDFKWKHNALRHSFISYRVADVKDVPRVALEAGNSPAMIFRHYRELVTEETAKAWFSIEPESAAQIIPMVA